MFSVIHYSLDSILKVKGQHSSQFLWNLISEKTEWSFGFFFESPLRILITPFLKLVSGVLKIHSGLSAKVFSINPFIKGANVEMLSKECAN